jgi:putative membrane protein
MAMVAGGVVIAFGAGPIRSLQAQATPSDLNADSKFIKDVTSGNLLEIRLGQLAEKKATNTSVKQFGQRMVTDHTNLENQWTTMVSKNGMRFQPGLAPEAQQEFNRLNDVSGAEFDRAYMTSMIQHHETDVNRFQTEGRAAHSAPVRDLVAASLPTLEQHLSLARQIGSQVGATNVAVAAPNGQVIPPNGQVPTQNGQVTTQNGQVATPSAQATGNVNADSKFIREVAADNQLEVRLGQMAESKATNPAVKQFAQRMVTDHIRLQDQWTGMASRNGMAFQPSMGSLHQQKVSRLERVSGAEFDRAYMTLMVQQHQDEVDYFQNEGRSARSAPVRDLVNSGLPILQQHLSLAKQVGGQVGADTTTAGHNQHAQGNQADGKGDLKADSKFLREVAADNLLEIRLGQMAQRKANNSAVKRFGERMVTDHTKLQDQWTNVASRNGLELKPSLGDLHQQKVDRLQKLSGKQFDRAYISLMIKQHQDAVDYFQNEGRSAESPRVRRLVADGLPILQQHLRMARQVGNQVGIETAATGSRHEERK